jgi:hypothetical protein
MYSTKLKIFEIEMHFQWVRSTTYLIAAIKVGEDLLKPEQ